MSIEDLAYEMGKTAAENPESLGAVAAILGSSGIAALKILESKSEGMTRYELQEASESKFLMSRYYRSKLEDRGQKLSGTEYSAGLADD